MVLTVITNAAAAQPCVHQSATGQIATIRGRVVSPSGAPVVGATVSARWNAWSYARERLSETQQEVSARTLSDGSYRLCSIPTFVQVSVSATAPGRASSAMVVAMRDTIPAAVHLTLRTVPSATMTFAGAINAGTSIVAGDVRDTDGAPVTGVALTIVGTDATVFSAADGRFRIAGLAAGDHVVSARRIGYLPARQTIRVAADATAPLSFVMTPIAVQLSEVVATAAASAFERETGFGERKRRGGGVFIDRAQLERTRPHKLSDVFRTVPGFQVQTALTRWGYQSTATMQRANTGARICQLDYYVNGHEYTPTSMGIDSDIPPAQIEAIEIYSPSETPPQFLGKRARCGVVVIWTRYRAHELSRN